MEEMGLAAGMAQEQRKPMQDINQIIQMIVNGVTPEELVAQGVPEELVMAAMDMISKQATEIPPQDAGLANTLVRPEQM